MRGISNFNLSFFFWLWLIPIPFVMLGLNTTTVSGLKIPALGRISHGIGSLYDGRTGNFLPVALPIFSKIVKSKNLNLNLVRRKPAYFNEYSGCFPDTIQTKLQTVFGPTSGFQTNDGLALRAALGMLEFPENGTAGLLLDKVIKEELSDISCENFAPTHTTTKFKEELIFPQKDFRHFNTIEKELRKILRQDFRRANLKVLKKATHVVVKVTRGSKEIGSLNVKKSAGLKNNFNSKRPLNSVYSSNLCSFRMFSDPSDFESSSNSNFDSVKYELAGKLSSKKSTFFSSVSKKSSPEDVPLSFELMPLLEFLNKSALHLTPSSLEKFQGLTNWTNPMEIDHSPSFGHIDKSWRLIRKIRDRNATLHEQAMKYGHAKNERLPDLQNLHDDLQEKFRVYKRDLTSLLEQGSTGTEQDKEMWESIYGQGRRGPNSNSPGVHETFDKVLKAVEQKFESLGGFNGGSTHWVYYYSSSLS